MEITDNFSGGWVKYKRTVSEYSETDFQAEILTYFRDDYNSFDYKDGNTYGVHARQRERLFVF